MDKPVAARLLTIRKAMGLTQSQLAKKISIAQGLYSKYETGSLDLPDTLKEALFQYGVDINWLITGNGEMFLSNERAHARAAPDHNAGRSLVKIPLVADIAAGTGIEAYDTEPRQILTIDPALLPLPGPYWAFRVEGDSMEPTLTTDDIAIVTRSWYEIDYNGMICAFRNDNGLLIKRVHIAPKAKYGLLIPINPRHKILQYDRSSPDLTLLGILVASIRLHNNT